MTAASVSIDRTSLTLSPLTISGDGSGTFSLTDKGLGRPGVTLRESYYPDADDVDGSWLRAVAREQTSLPLEVLVQASSSAALEAAIEELDAALWQFSYDVTVTVGGVGRIWHCTPATWTPTDGAVSHGRAAQFVEVLALSIPCHPIPEAVS